MTDLATVSAAIIAATSAVSLIDAIWDQVDRFLTGRSEPAITTQRIEQAGDAIVSKNGNGITFEKLG